MSDPPKRPRYLGPHEESNQTSAGSSVYPLSQSAHDAQHMHLSSIDCHSQLHDDSEAKPQSILGHCISGLHPQPLAELLWGSEEVAEREPVPSPLKSTSSSPLKSVSSSPSKSASSSPLKSASSSPLKSASSSPVKSASSSPVKSASSSPVKSASSSPVKSASSSPVKSASSSPVKSAFSSPVKPVPPSPLKSASSLTLKSEPSSPIKLASSSLSSPCSSNNFSQECEVGALPENCTLVTERVTEQKVFSQLNPRQQPQSECPHVFQPDFNISCDMETNAEALYDSESDSDEEIFESEEPAEQELREVLSQMTIDVESNEFDPEEYVNESTASEEGDPPLYEGACVTFHESIVSILTFALSFRLTGVCLKALLDLIFLHLPNKTASTFKTSLSAFKNYFAYIQGPKAYKYFCSKCFKELSPKSKCSVCKKSKVCYLVKLSMHQQLQALLQRPGFYSKLKFDHSNEVPEKYSDVYSGKLYQDLLQNGTLGRDTLTFQWYTDGAALYSSSKMSVWPVYLTINELPYAERFKKENLLVPIIWCGPVKPPGNILVNEMYEDLKSLFLGEEFNVSGEGKKIIKGMLLNGTGDTPARSLMLNMVQFNGAFSCQVCEQEGEGRPHCPGVRIFPFNEDDMIPRSLTNMEEYGKQGTDLKPVRGVKGPCSLASVMPNYVLGTAIDPMHQVYGGVSKKILSLLLLGVVHENPWLKF